MVVGATTVVNAESSRGFNGVKKPLVWNIVEILIFVFAAALVAIATKTIAHNLINDSTADIY